MTEGWQTLGRFWRGFKVGAGDHDPTMSLSRNEFAMVTLYGPWTSHTRFYSMKYLTTLGRPARAGFYLAKTLSRLCHQRKNSKIPLDESSEGG